VNDLHLTNYDFLFFAIIGASTIFAMLRGGVAQLLSLSTWFIALFVTKRYNDKFEELIPDMVSNPMFRTLLAYVMAFVAVAIVITLIKIVFHKFIHSFGLGGLNIAVGAIFGFARGLVICSIMVVIVEMIGIDKNHSWHNSLMSPIIIPTVKAMITHMDGLKDIEDEILKNSQSLAN
jgi:membrane protein required for colicin V production